MKEERKGEHRTFNIERPTSNGNARASFSSVLFPSAAVLFPLLALFAPSLVTGQVFVYRDAAHFYYPLFEWTAREWGEGRIPLWNPQENLGVPVVGETTSSVFYPGKLVFALPLLDFSSQYMFYIVGHALLAAWAAYFVARRWGASAPAAAACAISYACGGSVLFQIYNLVFLVSAAWLPLAHFSAEKMLAERSWRQALLFGATLALMTLGGDPQTAYHAGLLAVLYAFILGRSCRERPPWRSETSQTTSHPDSRNPDAPGEGVPYRASKEGTSLLRLALGRFGLLALAASAAFLLAAIQILPALEWSQASDRTTAAHRETIYEYSLSLWQLPQAVWPNFSGRPFPENHRWLSAISPQARQWTPSLYAGLLPLVVGLGSLRLWRCTPREKWLSWIFVLAMFAALGWFGLYWAFVNVLPGYALFRYPAKWLVPAALALSLLTAQGWDRAFTERPARLRLVLLVLGSLSAVGAGLLLLLRSSWPQLVSAAPPDDYFGPLDAAGSRLDATSALCQTALLGGITWWLLGRAGSNLSTRWSWAAVLLTGGELAYAQSGLIAAAPRSLFTTPSPFAAHLEKQESSNRQPNYRVFRASPEGWFPPAPRGAAANRQQENAAWERQTLYPRYHLLGDQPRISLVESRGTMMSRDLAQLLAAARETAFSEAEDVQEPQRGISSALGAKYLICPEHLPLRGNEEVFRYQGSLLVRNSEVWPRAYFVRMVARLGRESTELKTSEIAKRLAVGRQAPLAAVEAPVFVPDELNLANQPPGPAARWSRRDRVRILREEPQHMEIEALLEKPGLLVLSDLYFPGWLAETRDAISGQTKQLTIVRTNRVMRGVFLPTGQHHVHFVYRPTRFYWGVWLSGLAWVGLIVVWLYVRLRPGRRPAVNSP